MSALVVVVAVVAGGLGAVLRYAVTRAVAGRSPTQLTRAVLIVNVAGSVVAGVMIGLPGELQYVLLGGFAGGLTTFSTWTVETVQLSLDGRSQAAVGNIVLNLAAGLIAAVLTYAITVAVIVGATGAG